MTFDKSRLPSRHVSVGPERAPHRSYYYAMGMSEEQIAHFEKEMEINFSLVEPGVTGLLAEDEAEFTAALGRLAAFRRDYPGLEHRIGGLEKGEGHGNISYDPANHDLMVRTRQAKVDAVAATIPPTEVEDPSGRARVLVLGWGSTYGPIGAACRRVRAAGIEVAQAHLRHLNPFPPDLGEVLSRYDLLIASPP